MSIYDRVGSLGSVFAQAPIWMKIGIFFVSWIVLWIPIAIPVSIAVQWQPFKPLELRQKLPLVASLYLLAPLVLWGLSWLESVPFSTYGLAWNAKLFKSLGVGIAIGAIGILILFGIQTLFGWVRWKRENWAKLTSALLPTLLLGLWVGVVEELVFRGFLFSRLWQESDFWSAAIVSSGIFAVLHLVWEGKENIPQLPGLWLMGVVLCFAIPADSGSLGLAWGLHTGWIWMMASLDTAAVIEYPEQAPELMTGLDRKPLAGLMGSLFLLATAGVLLVIAGSGF